MDGGHVALPALGGSTRDDAAAERQGGLERKSQCRAGPSLPQSARLPQEQQRLTAKLDRDEQTIRTVYKKHAQHFFEEVKEGFLKEAALLRKQTQKALARTGGAWEGDSEISAPAVANLQAQISVLQRQLVEMQTGARPIVSDAHAGPCNAGSVVVATSSLEHRLARQQDEIKALARDVRNGSACARQAVLTPMWKERALQEIAQGELRTVCADEVGKAFQEFSTAFSEREVEAAVTRFCDSGSAPWEDRLRAEVRCWGEDLARQLSELALRDDEAKRAEAALEKRLATVEEEIGSATARLEGIVKRVDANEKRSKGTEAFAAQLHNSMAVESEETMRTRGRLEEHQTRQRALSKQVEDLQSALTATVAAGQRAEDVALGVDAARTAEAARIAEAFAQSAAAVAEHAVRITALEKRANGFSDLERNIGVIQEQTRRQEVKASEAALSANQMNEATAAIVAQHTARLAVLDDRVGGLQRSADRLTDQIVAHGPEGAAYQASSKEMRRGCMSEELAVQSDSSVAVVGGDTVRDQSIDTLRKAIQDIEHRFVALSERISPSRSKSPIRAMGATWSSGGVSRASTERRVKPGARLERSPRPDSPDEEEVRSTASISRCSLFSESIAAGVAHAAAGGALNFLLSETESTL